MTIVFSWILHFRRKLATFSVGTSTKPNCVSTVYTCEQHFQERDMKKQRQLATWLGILVGTLCAILLAGRASASEPLTQEFHQTTRSTRMAASSRKHQRRCDYHCWDRNEVQVDAIKKARRQDRLDEAKIVVESNANSNFNSHRIPASRSHLQLGRRKLTQPAWTTRYTCRGTLDSTKWSSINGSLENS